MGLTLKEMISSFTKCIDLYNYLLKNHHRRTAIAAYRIGMAMNLEAESLSNLVIAASLHDIGALTVTERDQLVKMDVENPYPHCSLGCYMLESFQPFLKISRIVYYHHWSYEDHADYIPEYGEVPIESYILHVADRTDILMHHEQSILAQKETIIQTIRSYRGTLFHPEVVDCYSEIAQKDSFWLDIENLDIETVLDMAISSDFEVEMTLDRMEEFAFTLSKMIDSRSQFALSHSYAVSRMAYAISELMGYTEEKCRKMRIAGLLHDMGKIAIPTELIEKKGELLLTERSDLRAHAYFTSLILHHIEGLGEIVEWASGHHENHDGTGYPMNLNENKISDEMDVIAYADIYTAFSENRPYRLGMKADEILNILTKDFKVKHGTKVLLVIEQNLEQIDAVCKRAVEEGIEQYKKYAMIAKKNQCRPSK